MGGMKEQLRDILSSKKYVTNEYIIKAAVSNELSLYEFLVLLYLDNDGSKKMEINVMSDDLGIDVSEAMEAFNNLMVKGLIALDSVKDDMHRFNEIVNLDGVYGLIEESIIVKKDKSVRDDVFLTFEKEMGRTLSQMQLELINGWLSSGTPEELIIGALKEAVYNGVLNFSYIDSIICEWEKRGFKTMDEVQAYIKNRRDSKRKDKEISKREEEISNFDWLDG